MDAARRKVPAPLEVAAAGLALLLTAPIDLGSSPVVARRDQPRNASAAAPAAELPLGALRADAVLAVTLERGAVATDEGLWIPQREPSSVVRVDARKNTAGASLPLEHPSCGSILDAFETLWVPLCSERGIVRLDRTAGDLTGTVPVFGEESESTLAAAVESVWMVTDRRGVVSRVDPATNAAVAEVYVPASPFALTATEDAVWVTSEEGHLLTRIDPHTNLIVARVEVGPQPGFVAAGEGAVWTLNRGDGSVTRVDPADNKVAATIAIGEAASGGALAAGEGAVWVSAPGLPLVRIDARTNRVTHRFTGDGGGAVIVAHGSVWINAGPSQTWRLDPKLVAAMRP